MKTPRALVTFGLFASLLLCIPVLSQPAQAARKSSHSAAKAPAAKKTPAPASSARKAKPAAKAAPSASRKAPAAGSKKNAPAAKAAPAQSCRTVKNKQGKSVRVCSKPAAEAAPVDPALRSPISGGTVDAASRQPDKDESKVRAAPERAYAVDGQSFFYQGRKYRIAGASGLGSNDMAKQRLQKALESGTLSIDPVSTDEGGVATATVRVNGRDLADQLK